MAKLQTVADDLIGVNGNGPELEISPLIPEPLQGRIRSCNEVVAREQERMIDFINLARELGNVPASWILRDLAVGFEPPPNGEATAKEMG